MSGQNEKKGERVPPRLEWRRQQHRYKLQSPKGWIMLLRKEGRKEWIKKREISYYVLEEGCGSKASAVHGGAEGPVVGGGVVARPHVNRHHESSSFSLRPHSSYFLPLFPISFFTPPSPSPLPYIPPFPEYLFSQRWIICFVNRDTITYDQI